MDYIANTRDAARLLGCDRHTVEVNARAGRYRYAVKHGGRWIINLSREFPALFGQRNAGTGGAAPAYMNGGSCNEDFNR